MAIIQMVNDIVLDVVESGNELHSAIRQADKPVIQLTIIEEQGGGPVWVNINQISSFMG